jgi:hypothetical protein
MKQILHIKTHILTRATLALLIITTSSLNTAGQNPIWIYGNRLISFADNSISTTALPQPGTDPLLHYTGQIATQGQTCQFDNAGNLLFFIVDGNIYDGQGYIIARGVDLLSQLTFDIEEPNQLPQLVGDIAVTNIPGFCDKFYLFTATKNTSGQTMLVVCSILDMAAQSVVFPLDPDRLGCLVSYDVNENYPIPLFDYFFEIDFDYPNQFFEGTFLQLTNYTDLKRDYHSMEIIEVSENHKLLVLSGHVDGIRIFELTLGNIAEIEGCDLANNDWGPGYFYGAVEAFPKTSGYKLAALSIDCDTEEQTNTNAISMHDLSASGVISNSSLVVVGSQDFETNLVTSIEFSPDGNYLWFTKNTAPEIGVVNLTTNDVTYPITGSLTPYAYSELESQIDENGTVVIYVSASSGIKKITSPNTPSSSTLADVTWDNGTSPCTATGGAGNNLIYTIQVQNTNTQIVQNFLSAAGCCHDYVEFHFGTVPTITTNNDGAWANYNNPFNNQNSPIRITDDLIFPTGTVTTITNMVFEFDEDADVIIEKGARVNLNGTTWTSLTCESIMWPGVNLLGTTNAASSIDQLPMTGGDQGYLYMNNSTIENAIRGVEAGTVGLNAGGIIRAYNSTFRNNQYDVILKKYHYINSGGYYVQNKSTFSNCTFITDAQLNNPILSPAYHAWLTEVDKINFTNCSFMNKTDINTYNWFVRGRGIYAVKASFTVDGLNDPWTGSPIDPDQTTFYKLRYGISSYGYNNPLAYYTCKQQEFQQCLYGIVNYNTDNVLIYQNNFQLPDAAGFNTDETMERGIYLTNSTGYVVEQNFFDGFDDFQVNEDYPCALGVWVDNSGDFANEIRNNDFDEMKMGTYVTRNNKNMVIGPDGTNADDDIEIDQTGLQLFCNTYTNGQTDIFRDSETLMRQDQGGTQPLPVGFLNAGNRFSAPDCNGSISDFVVDPNNTFYNNYWCHDQPNTIPDCGGTSNVPGVYYGMELLTNSVSLETYDDADCPNTYGGPIIIGPNPGVISGLVSQLGIVRTQLQSAKNTYLQVVDDNQKQSTLDILTEAFPHESQYYRDLLMQRYPLSADVIRKLIEQAPRLSPWHLTEVLLANSPLSKDLLYEIEQAEILSSFFMSFLYDADSGASLKRLMEMNMLSLATERDQLVQSIARAGLTYESDAESETDQPIYVNEYLAQLDLQSGASALRIRAAQLAANGDYTSALALVANEPLLVSYKSILEMEQSVAGDWALLSAAQTSALWDIYNAKKDYSSSMALAILQQIGVADFEPEPRVPIQYRSLQIAKNYENVALPLLGVWPNPATNSAWLHYPIEADEHATIEVYDPQGRLLNSFQPNMNGLVELSLKNYESGIYVVQLIAFDKVVESIKLTVVNQD